MRLGIDLVQLATKRLVDHVVLIAGDSDFVPAVKIARREGVKIILDNMNNNINPELQEHVDENLTFVEDPDFLAVYKNNPSAQEASENLSRESESAPEETGGQTKVEEDDGVRVQTS